MGVSFRPRFSFVPFGGLCECDDGIGGALLSVVDRSTVKMHKKQCATSGCRWEYSDQPYLPVGSVDAE